MSRTDRASASNRSRAVAEAGSTPLSKSKCRSYRASLVPANCTGPHPYCFLISQSASGGDCDFLIALLAIFLSSDNPAVDVHGIAAWNRVNWRDSQNLSPAEKAMPLNQLVDDGK